MAIKSSISDNINGRGRILNSRVDQQHTQQSVSLSRRQMTAAQQFLNLLGGWIRPRADSPETRPNSTPEPTSKSDARFRRKRKGEARGAGLAKNPMLYPRTGNHRHVQLTSAVSFRRWSVDTDRLT